MKTITKKSVLFIALFAAFVMIITGCKKNNDSDPTPTPPPGPTTTTLYYTVSNYDMMTGHTGLDCFHFTFTYTEEDGSTVTVDDPELPWTKSITVTAPFEAKLEGHIFYNEEDMPDTVCFCRAYDLSKIENNPYLNTKHLDGLKENMINLFNAHPDRLTFSATYNVEE